MNPLIPPSFLLVSYPLLILTSRHIFLPFPPSLLYLSQHPLLSAPIFLICLSSFSSSPLPDLLPSVPPSRSLLTRVSLSHLSFSSSSPPLLYFPSSLLFSSLAPFRLLCISLVSSSYFFPPHPHFPTSLPLLFLSFFLSPSSLSYSPVLQAVDGEDFECQPGQWSSQEEFWLQSSY